ncbi:MAG: S41 family peptidase [Chitinophagaceae bacterium]
MTNRFLLRGRFIVFLCALFFIVGSCEKILHLKKPLSDPESIFEELWITIDQQYALFSVKQLNWNTVYQDYKSRVIPTMSEGDLFKVLSEMLDKLKDGHVVLMNKKDTAAYDDFFRLFPKNFNYTNVLNTYLKNDFKKIGPVQFKIVSEVGYIYYKSFAESITEEELDQLMMAMNNTKGLIVDIRSNPGGKSSNADKLAGRFMPERKLVKYELFKKGIEHDNFHDPRPYYLNPARINYPKKVVLLTNRSCFSACNDFVLYMSELPLVTIIGDQTGGGGSVPANYILANGWKLQFSATKTLSPAKVSIENGIEPDIFINISPIDETNGKDPILERAFLLLQ